MNDIIYFSWDDLDSKEYLDEICSFTEITQETLNTIRNYKSNYSVQDDTKRLWAIFGKNSDNDNWLCLEVGSSININVELKENLNAMKSKSLSIKKSTLFHKEVYDFKTYMDKHSVKYRAMYEKCEKFIIYEINVCKYLKTENYGSYDPVNYAEVMFAYKTKAMFWNLAPETYGNQEREIYDRVFKNKEK